MKIKSVNLETVCGITSKLPDNNMLEIAFAVLIELDSHRDEPNCCCDPNDSEDN